MIFVNFNVCLHKIRRKDLGYKCNTIENQQIQGGDQSPGVV